MNKLSLEKRAAIVRSLVEGNSVRATVRMTGAAKGTVLKLLAEVGSACLTYCEEHLVDLPCKRVQCDEIWAFVGAKQKNATQPGQGDIWTWTAICADTKLIACWHVGGRTPDDAYSFMSDLAGRLANRVQLTTDGLNSYRPAVERAFGWNGTDYAQLVKVYGHHGSEGHRYSPPALIAIEKQAVMGRPNPKDVSTSFVERSNMTMRMSMRRFTRLTNGFSKKVENHMYAVSLNFMHYNFCRRHITLEKANRGIHTTPAMANGLTDHVWTVEELLETVTKGADQ